MKKTGIILLAVTLALSCVSLAEDLSSLSDRELMKMYVQVTEEMADRQISVRDGSSNGNQAAVDPEKSMLDRLVTFLSCWSENRQDDMLSLCSPAWKAETEVPRVELFTLMGNRTPLSATVSAAFGNPADTVRTVAVTVMMDRNNGKAPRQCRLWITMVRETDGLWYVDPASLQNYEYVDEVPEAEPTPVPAEETSVPAEETPVPAEKTSGIPGDMVLYYQPDGGQYYHADQNCRRVHEQFLPLSGCFTYAQLDDDPYKGLLPCDICGAPPRRENQSPSGSFRDTVDAAGEGAAIGSDMDYLAVAMMKDGRYLRAVTLLDDQARELYMVAMSDEDPGEAIEAFNTYAWSLPVSYTEEITARPREQAELDALAGKTVSECEAAGYLLYGSGGGVGIPAVVDLSNGLFNYTFEVDASFEEYKKHMEKDDLESLKVKSGKLSGFSGLAANPDYLASGAYEPQIVPHMTAEEAAAADAVPPPEEYTADAWPLTAEAYTDLLNNMESGYGQVYMIEGVVHQVLSRSPLRVIINTGGNGKSQPVVVECSRQLSPGWEAGSFCRIYADVSSACYILPVLTARYVFTE